MTDEEDKKVNAIIAGRLVFDSFRKKGYTLDQMRTVAKAIYDSVNDERERLDGLGGKG